MRFIQFASLCVCAVLLISACAQNDNTVSYNSSPKLIDASENSPLLSNFNEQQITAQTDSQESVENLIDSSDSTKANLVLATDTLGVSFHDQHSDSTVSINALTGAFIVNDAKPYAFHRAANAGASNTLALPANHTNALKLNINSFAATVDGEKHSIYINDDFSMDVEVININAEFAKNVFHNAINPYDQSLTGRVEINIAAGTTLVVKKVKDQFGELEITKVESGGPMTILGSDYFLFNESISLGECFIWEHDYLEFGSGFERVVCPM